MPAPSRPLIVRLRNWVGDVTLAVPLLQRLHDAGYALQLVGKAWAQDLLAGHGWPVHKLPAGTRERIALLRRLRAEAAAADPSFARRLNALCLPDSFSSALEFRLAGLRAAGHAWEGRSLLLGRALPRQRGLHELRVYWQLGDAWLQDAAEPPAQIGLRISPQHVDAARALRAAHGLSAGSLFICPFAGGTWSGQDKTWPAFPEFAAQVLPRYGRAVVVCPGPGEEAEAQARFGSATVLTGVKLGTYAALLQEAALMVSNDTGPGHIAAAVGTPLVSVMGPSDPRQWQPWGRGVQVVQAAGGGAPGQPAWPDVAQVQAAVESALAGASPARG